MTRPLTSSHPTAMKITPFLWFDGNLDDALTFYASVFEDAKIDNVRRAGGGPGAKGKAFSATFRLAGQEFMALDGGPQFKFNEAVSFFVQVETQAEVDELWEKLTAGGTVSRCGWLKDRFGLSWQIIPSALGRLLGDPDPARAQRVMQAMLGMTKIDIAGLQRAYEQAA